MDGSVSIAMHRTLEQLIKEFPDAPSLMGATITGIEANLILQHHEIVVYQFSKSENNHHSVQYSEDVIRDHRDIIADTHRSSCSLYCAYGSRFTRQFNYTTSGHTQFENVWAYRVSFLAVSTVTFISRDELKSNVIVLSDCCPIKEIKFFWNTPHQVTIILDIASQDIIQPPWNLDQPYNHLQKVNFYTRADPLLGASEDDIISVLTRHPSMIRDIPNPTLAMNRTAVTTDGLLLKFIQDADEELEILAVNNTPDAIQFVKSPRPALLDHVARSHPTRLLLGLIKGGNHLMINQSLLEVCFLGTMAMDVNIILYEMYKQKIMHLIPNQVIVFMLDKEPSAAECFAQIAYENSISQQLFEQIINLESLSEYLYNTLEAFFKHDYLVMSDDLLRTLLKSRPELIMTLQKRHRATPDLWEVALTFDGTLINCL